MAGFAPIGYINARDENNKSIIIPNEETAQIKVLRTPQHLISSLAGDIVHGTD